MSATRGARQRARIEVTAAIKNEARKQLVAEGAAKLSLRAVSRQLGMASSALYRYFPNRDELLTALIVEAFDSLGEAAESALKDATGDHVDRWVTVCEAVRTWALEHSHEYALIYGSPVPGYTAPQATVGPASRVAYTLVSVVHDAQAAGDLALPPLSPALKAEATRIADEFAPGLSPQVAAPLVAAWSQLFGTVSFEIFGQFNRVVEDRDAFFHHTATQLAHQVGLQST